MKTKITLFSVIFGLLYLVSCNDEIDSIGEGIQPDKDKITVFDMSINIKGETVKLDSIYAKSISGLLGKFNNPVYGSLKGGYASQYYPSEGFVLDSMISNEIDSVQLKILYFDYVGDSLAPLEVSVFPLNKELTKDYYTNTNPSQFADMNNIWGRKTYTARDLNISDSLNLANIKNNSYKVLSVSLPKEEGQRILEEYKKEGHGAFGSATEFKKFFPGTYIESTFGNGCLLDVEKTSIYIYYQRKRKMESAATGNDTIVVGTDFAMLDVTKEVIQMNEYINTEDSKLLNPDPDKMYIKTPAGLFSKITIPLAEIVDSLGNRKFSNVQLELQAYPKEDTEYAWDFPGTGKKIGISMAQSKLLLVEKDSLVSFFEQEKVADDASSYYSTLSSSSYVFKNISTVVQNAIDKTKDGNYKDLELLLIPVSVPYYIQTDAYYNQYAVDYASNHYLYPSAVTLKKGGDNLKLHIIAVDINSDSN